jgi:chromosome segregation ATPase
MSFAQALNEAKGVILQLSNRVKADAEKIRSQQDSIAAKSATVAELEGRVTEMTAAHAAETARLAGRAADEAAQAAARHAEQVAGLETRIKDAEAAGAHAEAILNRQGERILSLESAAAEREAEIADLKAEIANLIAERDAVRSQLPSDEDAAALASMAQLLIKAAPAIEKAKKSAGPKMRLADDAATGADAIAEAA